MVDRCYSNSDYERKKNEEYVRKLREYVKKNRLSAYDAKALDTWVAQQKIIAIHIYKDQIRVFDSEYPSEDLWKEEVASSDYEWLVYYPVKFSDGTAKVCILGMYEYQFYNGVLICSLVISFLFFLALVLTGIRRKMNDIRTLSREIEILEGGSLDYEITVKGHDEISILAEGIENMRLSFQNLIRQETELVQENQRIVTEMSHDLRTPITSMMLYLEILKKGNYKDSDQMKEYWDKIENKVRRMKQLTDHLFAYSLITGETEVVLEEPEIFEVLFYDLLSETCSYLEQKGFRTSFRVEWIHRKIRISTEYLLRIMDNITSNIMKYADPAAPVWISSVEEGTMAGITVENKILFLSEEVESTGIGIQSVKNMMNRMQGVCRTERTEEIFRITLLFPASMDSSVYIGTKMC